MGRKVTLSPHPSISQGNNTAPSTLSIGKSTTSPMVTLTPNDAIIEIFQDGDSIVRLERDGTVRWANKPDPDSAAAALGEALRSSVPIIAGIEASGRHIIEEDLISFLMVIAEREGPLSTDNLKTAFEHIRAMKRLRGEI